MRNSRMRKGLLVLLAAAVLFVMGLAAAACGGTERVLRFFDGENELPAIEAAEGSELAAPEDPVRDGLTFEGWSRTEGGAIEALPEKVPAEDRTYFAQWSAPLTLTSGEGGTVSASPISVRVGANLSSALNGQEPKDILSGLTFAGWYLGGQPLSAEAVMPAGPLTLTAKYSSPYTLSVYRQNVDGSYPASPETESKVGIFGEKVQYVSEDAHYSIDPAFADGTLASLGVGQTLTVHLRRASYQVTFAVNLPAGTPFTAIPSVTTVYGGSAVAADAALFGLSANYRFAGWAETADGAPCHEVGETIANIGGNLTLYACWDVAYTDRFGGEDLIFLLQWEQKALLVREGLPEKFGTFDGADFSFGENGPVGRVSEADRTFSYFREAAAKTYSLYDPFDQAIGEATLTLDGYFGATYSAQAGGEAEKGTYVLDPATRLYTFVPERGRNTFTFYLGTWNYQGETKDIFAILGEEANFGSIDRCSMVGLGTYGFYSDYAARFDGMGSVTIASMGTFSYRPAEEDNEFEIIYRGNVLLKMLVIPFSAHEYGWIAYDSELAGEYHDAAGEILELDGYGVRASYDGRIMSWVYLGKSELSDRHVVSTVGNVFLIDPETHTFALAEQSFSEYFWLNAEGGLGAKDRYLVLYEDRTAALYSEDTKLTDGTFTVNDDGSYTFTPEKKVDGLPSKFTFCTDTEYSEARSEYVSVYWITEEWDAAGKKTEHYTEYSGEGVRIRDYGNGHADYFANGTVYHADSFYKEQELSYFHVDYLKFRYRDAAGYLHTLYFHVGEGNTLKRATNEPTSYNFADEKHERITRGAPLFWIDGIDRARYFGPETPIGGQAGKYAVHATSTPVDDDITVYAFTPDDKSEGFTFIIVTIETFQYILRYNAEKAGEFTSADGKLLLDGFPFEAIYTDARGVRSLGQYVYLSDDLIRFTDVNTLETRYFHLSLDEKTFVAADSFYGDFFSYEDYTVGEDALRFDGLGGAKFGRFTYDYFGEVTGFKEVASGSYTIEDEDYGILSVTLEYADGRAKETFRVLLMIIDGGYYDHNVYVRAFSESRTYVSDTWEVLMLDGFGFATYVDAEGYASHEVQYTEKEGGVTFILDGYAHEVTLQGTSFSISDIYFNPVLYGEYGDASYLTTGGGKVFVRVWQIDEEGTLVAEITGEMTDGSFLSYDGKALPSVPRLPFTMTYTTEGGQLGAVITAEYKLDGHVAVLEYRLVSTFLSVLVVERASYYWTKHADWTKDGVTVRVYRYVSGSAKGTEGQVMRFELLADGKVVPTTEQGLTENGCFAMVPVGAQAGYYEIAFAGGDVPGLASVTKHKVETVVGTESLGGGVSATATAYYALVEGEPLGLHITYTESDFDNGQIYDLETAQVEKLSEGVYYIYATYTYSGGAGVSEFHYVVTLGDKPSIRECQSGYVYSEGDEYSLYVLISYEGLYAYDFAEFYVGNELVGIVSTERDDAKNCWYLYTGTEKYSVSFREASGMVELVCECVEKEKTESKEATLDGTTYTVVYSLAYGKKTPFEVRSLSVGGQELPCTMRKASGSDFYYAVLEGDHAGYYKITFTVGTEGVTAVSLKKYEVSSVEYTYTYYVGEYASSTLFKCYYAMDGGTFLDVILTTYRTGSAAGTYAFDPYLTCKDIGGGRYWLTYLVGSTYYHLVLSTEGKSALGLCYYAYSYDDSDYIFLLLYDMTTGELYALGDVMATDGERYSVVSAVKGDDGVWTVTTDSAVYKVKFTYNSETETYAAEVTPAS